MGLDIRKVIGRRAANGVASIKELQKLFSNVVATTSQTLQTITSNFTMTGDLSVTGDTTLTGTVGVSDDATFAGDIVSSAYSATYDTTALLNIKEVTVEQTIAAGASEVIEVDVPIGALLLGAAVIAATDLTFTTGTEVAATLTAEGSTIAASLASKNDKGSIMVVPSLVAGAVETITLTADAGTVDTGVVVGTVWYIEPTDFTDVA